MKKIYMILAAMTLLTLSLNAQVDTQTKAKPISKTRLATFNFNDVLRNIKGMESILSVSGPANGPQRAPFRYDASLFNTLGPFTGDNFDYGIGFPEAYPEAPQDILVTTVLNRSEYESHIGEQIVGFRFALWGDASKTVKVADFISYPFNSNSGFDQNHLYEWTLADLEGNEPPSDDPVETTKYVKVTSSSDLTSGEYLIVCEAQNVIFDGSVSGSTLNGANSTAAPTISNNAIEYTADLDAKDFTIDMSNGTVKSASGYYIGCENTNNAVSYNQNTQYTNTITVNSGTASIIYRYNNANRPLKCNTQNNVFRYYKTTSSGVADIQLYKKVTTSSKAPRRADRETVTVVNNDFSDASWWTVYDENNDNTTWSVSGGYATYPYNSYNAANDWLVSSAITLEAGKTYTFRLDSWRRSTSYEEKLEVKLASANTVSALSTGTTVITETAISSTSQTSPDQLSNTFTVSSSGNYYIGIHAVSDADKWALYVDNMIIETDDAGGDSNEGYVELEPGQWHEFYLDQPVTFDVENDDDQLFMGYWYKQYPLSSQNDEAINPAAVNSQSTGHNHYVNMVAGSAGAGDLVISLPYSMNIRTITVYDTNGNTLTTWDASTAYNNSDYTSVSLDGSTYAAYNLPTGWSISDGNYLLSWNNSSYGRLGYLLGDDNLTIASSALNGNTTVRVVMYVYDDNGSGTISVNGQSQTIGGSPLANYTWNNVDLSATVYERSWFNPDFSEVGDLAVQLIFRTPLPKLITPEDGSTVDVGTNTGSGTSTTVNVSGSNLTQDLTVSVSGTGFSVTPTTISAADANAGTTITVSYNGTDPNATGTLTISSGEVTTTVTLTATCEFTPELTAPANGSTVNVGTNTGSGTSTTVTVSGSYLTQDLSVSVNGDGFSVSPTIISAADANAGTTITVTYNGTDPDATGTLTISSGEVTTTVSLSATYSESEPAFSTNGIIRMGNLIIVDQFWASTAENTHPEQYSYILRYTPAQGDPKESSPKTVDVEHVKSVVNGYYTEEDVKNDSITYNTVIVNKMTADVEMTLPNNDNQIYYVRLQGKDNDVPSEADKVNDNSDMIVKLQMTSGDGGFYYIDQIPTSHPQYTPGQVNHFMDPAEPGTGSSYGDFKSYVPSVMTYGQSRRYFANDTLHNTYGAPVWRTGIGDVTIQNGMKVERQSNQWGTTQWEANGQACSLYILDNILAYGKLPNKQNSNVDYEPYMFRVFVESPSGKLRGYTPQNVYSPEKPDSIIGTELVADNSFTNFTGPICIYSEYFDGASHIDTVADATNGDYFQFTLNKNSDNWVDNAMFGGLDDIIQGEGDDLSLSDNDLKVYVRFYYRSKGSINPSHVIRGRDASLPHMYYGAEAKSPTPDPWTSVTEVRSHGEIIGVTYVNAQGMTSNKPFDGLNIVVTRYSDGSTTTTKVVR